jgi:HPt (histidine-containing phosphotransfer) domain-containing protein
MSGQAFTPPPELVRAYLAKLQDRLGELAKLQDSGDREAVIELCHRLAGSAGLYGLPELGSAAGGAETAVRQGTDLDQALRPLFEAIAAAGP